MKLKELLEKYFKDVIAENPAITTEIDTIFEAAVTEAVAIKITEKEAVLEGANEVELKEFKEGVVDKLDEYISLSMGEFVEENKVNIHAGIRVELAEKTFAVVKTLFTEAAIEIPEAQKTAVVDLEKRVETLSSQINEAVNSDLDSKKQIFEYEKTLKFMTLAKELSETKKEKLSSLLDNISCENIDDFEKKLVILKESISEQDGEKKDKKLLEDEDGFEAEVCDLDKYLP